MKKYEFTGETMKIGDTTLHRIRALKEIDLGWKKVKPGDLGGWLEKEENLSQDGNAWVFGDAKVYGNANVWGDAKVYGNAIVCDHAEAYDMAQVFNNAMILDRANVMDNAKVFGNARVKGDSSVCENALVCGYAEILCESEIYGNAKVCQTAMVFGNAKVYGNAEVCLNAKVGDFAIVCDETVVLGTVRGNAEVSGTAQIMNDAYLFAPDHVLTIGAIGSQDSYTTFSRDKQGNILVNCGCFYGTLNKFLAKVEKTYGDSKHGQVYRKCAELAQLQIDTTPVGEE